MGPWMFGSNGYGFSALWGVLILGFWALAILFAVLLIVWILRRLPGQQIHQQHDDRAMSILRERFARGEISKEQFDEMRHALE